MVYFAAMRTLVFVHGGPGLTTVPERRWFGSDLDAAGIPSVFWNEPSRTRPEGPPFQTERAFSRAVETLAKVVEDLEDIVWVAHSCGIHYVLALPEHQLAKTRHAVLVAPSFALREGIRQIAVLAATDFREHEPEKAARLEQLLSVSTALFDDAMADAAQLALSDATLLTHYWQDPAAMARFMSMWQEPGAALDPECFFAVLRDLSPSWHDDLSHLSRVNAPAIVVFGDRDPIVDSALAMTFASDIFSTAESRTMPHAGHFPHLEHQEPFLEILREVAAG